MDCPVAPRLRPPFGRHPPRLSPRTMSLDPRAPTESSLAGSFAVPPLMGFEPSSTRRFSAEVALAGVEPRCVLGASSPRGRLPNASGGQDWRRNGGSAARRQRGSIAPELPDPPAGQGRRSALFKPSFAAVTRAVEDSPKNVRRGHPRRPASSKPAPPLHRHHRVASTPGKLPANRTPCPSAPTVQGRSPVPSSWFLTTSTAFSATRLAGLLHPAANPGVRPVSPLHPPSPFDDVGLPRFPGTPPPLGVLPRSAAGAQSPAPLLPPRCCLP